MRHAVKTLRIASCAAALLSSSALAAGTDLPGEYQGKYRVTHSVGINYSNGDYGQAEDTSILYVPLTTKMKFGHFTGKVTVPFISITGPGVVVGDGEVTDGTAGASATEEGLGDIVTGLMYTRSLRKGTSMDVGGDIKLPTADETRGLGTGSADFTAYVGLTQVYGDAFFNARVGRKFNGDTPTTSLHDIWKYSAGAGYKLTPDLTMGATYNYREAATEGGKNPDSASAYAAYKLTKEVSAQGYVGTGFDDASPDFTTGVTLSYRFNVADSDEQD